MNVQEEYRKRLTDFEGALSHVADHDNIVVGGAGNEARGILSQLHTIAPRVDYVRVFNGLGMYEYPFLIDTTYRGKFLTDCVFMMGAGRKSHRAGLTAAYPGHLHLAARNWMDVHHPNVFIASVTPMDEHGFFCMPLCLIHEKDAALRADKIILEVNPNLPRVYGETELHISQVAAVVENPMPLPILPAARPTEVERTIGGYIAELVHDGDTIQLGIGGVPDSVAEQLMDKRHLGVHTEMFTTSMVDLVEAGVIDGSRKTLHPGKMIGVFALGEQRLYDMMNDNLSVRLMRGSYVNDPQVISQNDNFVSINSGLNADLTGQVCSESIGSLIYSGVGGQADTAVGATHSKGGRSIIALRSTVTTKDGVKSNINAQLPAGSAVSLSRHDVDYIVTEYGVAPMRGYSVRDRVEHLIAVAHPDWRTQLREDARRLLLW